MTMTFDEAVAAITAPDGAFSVHEEVIEGLPQLVFHRTPPSLRELWATLRDRDPDQVFLVYEDERWTFADVAARIDAMAALLVDRYGVAPGDRVAIAMRNYPEWVTSFAAATSIGAIAVAMNAWWTTDELGYGLRDSGAKVLVADHERVERVLPLLARDDASEVDSGEGSEGGLDLRVLAVRLPADERHDRVDRMEDVLVPNAPVPDVEVTPGMDATILYTSGTTGGPKGAVSTHRAVLSALMAFACRSIVHAMVRGPVEPHPYPTCFILTVPLFHVTGLVPVMLGAMLGGNRLVMMYRWSPERALELIERERVTTFVGVPTMSWDLLESPDFATRDTSSLQSVGGGGAPAPPELVRRIDDGFTRGRPSIGYGMTETNAYGPQNMGDDYVRKPRSAGRTVPIMKVIVTDAAGREVPRGEVGEIRFTGPNLIRGYWNKPEATADTIVDGWLRTGDIGRMDDEGFVYVEDRAKDMVIRGGENIYCAEVEAVIYEHPDVHEVAVFGIPHERLGEELVAAVHPKRGRTIVVAELQAFVGERLASFKVPTKVLVLEDQLPRGATGKILKRELRDEILGTT